MMAKEFKKIFAILIISTLFVGCGFVGSPMLECNDPTVLELASELSIEIVDDGIVELATITCNTPGVSLISADCQGLFTSLFSTMMSPHNVQLEGMRPSSVDESIGKIACEASFSFEYESQDTEEILVEAFVSHEDFNNRFDQGDLEEFADSLVDGWGAAAGFGADFFQELNQIREEVITVTGEYDAQLTDDDLIYVNVELEGFPMNFLEDWASN